MTDQTERLTAEIAEQCRLLGMSGEREARLLAEIDRLKKDQSMTPTDRTLLRAVPLIERLRAVPLAARYLEHGEGPFPSSSSFPVGPLCHEAAEALQVSRRNAAEVARITNVHSTERSEQAVQRPVDAGERTGWAPGMLQDDSRELSRWLGSKPDAMQRAREAAADATPPAPPSPLSPTPTDRARGVSEALGTDDKADMADEQNTGAAAPQSGPSRSEFEGLARRKGFAERQLLRDGDDYEDDNASIAWHWFQWSRESLAASQATEQPKCAYCDGKGWAEDGDPEIGSASIDCDRCGGTGSADTDQPADRAQRDELPPLPEPAVTSYQIDSVMRSHELHTYSAGQMQERDAMWEERLRAALQRKGG